MSKLMLKANQLKNKKGFTLIEMLVVIAIIAVLVAIIIPTVTSATGKSKAATDAANLRSAKAALTIGVLDGTYSSADNTKTAAQWATALGVPEKSKYDDSKSLTITITDASGNNTGATVEVKYGTMTIEDFATIAGGETTVAG